MEYTIVVNDQIFIDAQVKTPIHRNGDSVERTNIENFFSLVSNFFPSLLIDFHRNQEIHLPDQCPDVVILKRLLKRFVAVSSVGGSPGRSRR